MRKWILALAILIILAIGSIYWFIPSQLNVVQITPVHCPATAAFRTLSTQSGWHKWWPTNDTGNRLQYNGSSFHLTKTLLNTFTVQVGHGHLFLAVTVNLLPLPADSVAVQWKFSMPAGNNPFTRIERYRQAVAIKENMAAVSNAFRMFAEQKKNLYGIDISETTVKDTLLVATKASLSAYPVVADVYKQVARLQQYSSQQHAQITGHPMLNITPLDSSHFQIMVALPVNKRLPDNGPFFRRNLVPGKFLFTSIQGGPGTIQQTFKQLQLYVEDFRRTAMAIPFQTLVTDRSVETDTSKWITHIYVPVF